MGDKILANYTNAGKIGGEVTSTKISSSDKTGLDVTLIGGSSAAGGQDGPVKIIKVALTTSITNLTTTLSAAGQTSYNSINIQNRSGVQVEWNATASWTLGDGWTIDNGTDFFIDLTQVASIFIRTLSGAGDIKVLSVDNTA